ncbi:MAG: rod shape-determining protein [Gammaproteobacteria bacterium]|nr:rod shape-determining protein [Gammaproteobacteria bacterium]
MLRNILSNLSAILYVQIWEYRIKVTDIKTLSVFDEKPLIEIKVLKNGKKEVVAFGNAANIKSLNPFSHPRGIISDFIGGEKLLEKIIHKVLSKGLFTPSPSIIMHVMEKNEGGLTVVEIRALREMAAGAGARSVVVYQGPELNVSSINFDELAK